MGKVFAKIIGCGLAVLFAIAAVGLIYKYTNGFNEDFKTFYVEYDGKQILTAESKLSLKYSKTHTFNVKYTFDTEKSEPKDYKVKIIPNVERDFDYTVNGEKYLYSKTGELTSAFGLEKEQSQFFITIPEDAETHNIYPYRLVVSSYNEKVTFNIDFKIIAPDITDVTLNPDEVIFSGKDTPDAPATPTAKKYDIDYDSLGWAGLSIVNLNCPGKGAAGEKVTFTATVKPEYANEYKISGINVNLSSGEAYIEDLRGKDGTYTFTMPDTKTMEEEGYITLMFYIIPIDM